MISRVNQKRRQAKLITNAPERKAALAKLDTTYTQYVTQLTANGDAMAQNLQTIYQDEQQTVQDELTRISNVYQTQQDVLQGKQTGAQAMGNFSALPAIDTALANSAKNQISKLQDALRKAEMEGDTTTAAQIKQSIAQLQGSIAEYTASAVNDAISAIQQAGQTSSARTTLLTSLAGVATSQGRFGLAGALNQSAYQNAVTSDQSQISQYAGGTANFQQIAAGNYSSVSPNSPLGIALASGNTGAVATITQSIDQLAADLATNTQSLVDNTAATEDATTQYNQARASFVTGTYGTIGNIIQAAGQATGQLDIGALEQSYQGQNQALGSTVAGQISTANSTYGLNIPVGATPEQFATYAEANLTPADISHIEATGGAGGGPMSQEQVTAFEDLITSLTDNESAIETNTIAINTLNGQLTQPQSFTSSAFASFRDAIFTGMGGLNPNYATPLGVSNPVTPGLAGANAPGQTVQHIAVTTNPAATPVDGSTIGQQIAMGIKVPSR